MSIKSLFSCCYSSANVKAIPTTPSNKVPNVDLQHIASEALNQKESDDSPSVNTHEVTPVSLRRTQSSSLLSLSNKTEEQPGAAPLRRTQSSPSLSLPKEAEKQPGAALTDLTIKEEEAPKTAVSYKRAALGFGLTALGLIVAGLAYRYFNQGSLPTPPNSPQTGVIPYAPVNLLSNEVCPATEKGQKQIEDLFRVMDLNPNCLGNQCAITLRTPIDPSSLMNCPTDSAKVAIQPYAPEQLIRPETSPVEEELSYQIRLGFSQGKEKMNEWVNQAQPVVNKALATTSKIASTVGRAGAKIASDVSEYAGSRLHDFMNKPKLTPPVGTPVKGSYGINFS